MSMVKRATGKIEKFTNAEGEEPGPAVGHVDGAIEPNQRCSEVVSLGG